MSVVRAAFAAATPDLLHIEKPPKSVPKFACPASLDQAKFKPYMNRFLHPMVTPPLGAGHVSEQAPLPPAPGPPPAPPVALPPPAAPPDPEPRPAAPPDAAPPDAEPPDAEPPEAEPPEPEPPDACPPDPVTPPE